MADSWYCDICHNDLLADSVVLYHSTYLGIELYFRENDSYSFTWNTLEGDVLPEYFYCFSPFSPEQRVIQNGRVSRTFKEDISVYDIATWFYSRAPYHFILSWEAEALNGYRTDPNFLVNQTSHFIPSVELPMLQDWNHEFNDSFNDTMYCPGSSHVNLATRNSNYNFWSRYSYSNFILMIYALNCILSSGASEVYDNNGHYQYCYLISVSNGLNRF